MAIDKVVSASITDSSVTSAKVASGVLILISLETSLSMEI